jgi:cell division protein FtsA
MSSNNPIGIIELGNVSIKCLIFKINNINNPEILSTSKISSQGIHNGVVVNLDKATKAIRSCISNAEKQAGILLKKINVIIEQPDFLCTKFSKSKKINGSKIYKNDIEFLLSEAKKQVTLNDSKQSIVHIFNHNYIVDGKIFIEEPIDVYADHLSHEMTFITMPKNNIKNIYQTFIDCDIEIERFISCSFSLAVQLLNSSELQYGSILVDIGFEKTSLVIFKNLAIVNSITFPLGSNHITKDLSKVCSLSLEESEVIKNNLDIFSKKNSKLFDKNAHLINTFFTASSFRKISESLILSIVQARLDEILKLIKKQIDLVGLNSNVGLKIFLVGGGSKLINLNRYCSDFFNIESKTFENDNKKISQLMDDSFNSCLGALKIINDGWETEAIPATVDNSVEKISFFSKIFKSGL